VLRLFTPVRLLGVLATVLVTTLVLWVFPSSDYIFLPDKAHPVAPLVTVQGGHDPHGPGAIYFVDVYIRKATVLETWFGGMHDGADLHPASDVVPPGVTSAEQQTVDAGEMRTSQEIAAAVALRSLGEKVTWKDTGALVTAVEPGFPAVGKLAPTDVIIKLGATRVRTPDALSAAMHALAIGSTVTFTVRRGTHTRVVVLHTVASAKGSRRGVVGILLDRALAIELPRRVSIDAHGVGGPSAGLAFALEVREELGHDVTHGHRIAATGQILLDGTVLPIGGIKQKTIGARKAGVDTFLVPAGANATEARRYAGGIRVIAVKSYSQALHAMATLPQAA